jgi:hypothetical protein
MSKVAIVDKADKADDRLQYRPVIAVFATVGGSFRYIVDADEFGALQSSTKENLVPQPANLM